MSADNFTTIITAVIVTLIGGTFTLLGIMFKIIVNTIRSLQIEYVNAINRQAADHAAALRLLAANQAEEHRLILESQAKLVTVMEYLQEAWLKYINQAK